MTNIDNTIPEGKWVFDKQVTDVFDSMLSNSIPNYEYMRELTFLLGRKFVQFNTSIIDLGASLGRALQPFAEDQHISTLSPVFHAYEVSEPMIEALRKNPAFKDKHLIIDGDIRNTDFLSRSVSRGQDVVHRPSLVLSILTLQFTPIEYRHRILRNIYKALMPGGAFILVEKVLGSTAEMDDLLVDAYYETKAKHGYTKEQINAKRKSLEGVLVPTSVKWNEDLLHASGFSHVEGFYRGLNFCGWIAVKEGD